MSFTSISSLPSSLFMCVHVCLRLCLSVILSYLLCSLCHTHYISLCPSLCIYLSLYFISFILKLTSSVSYVSSHRKVERYTPWIHEIFDSCMWHIIWDIVGKKSTHPVNNSICPYLFGSFNLSQFLVCTIEYPEWKNFTSPLLSSFHLPFPSFSFILGFRGCAI